jgi:outer membrane murein-binding lipoprotein Lpp
MPVLRAACCLPLLSEKKPMKNSVIAVVVSSILVAGCAHRAANPVPVAQVGDETKSCRAIINEMQEMKNTALAAEGDRNSQVAQNVGLGVAGAFLLVPWFFMDTGNAATVEQRAAVARFKRLNAMAEERNCDVTAVTAPVGAAAN